MAKISPKVDEIDYTFHDQSNPTIKVTGSKSVGHKIGLNSTRVAEVANLTQYPILTPWRRYDHDVGLDDFFPVVNNWKEQGLKRVELFCCMHDHPILTQDQKDRFKEGIKNGHEKGVISGKAAISEITKSSITFPRLNQKTKFNFIKVDRVSVEKSENVFNSKFHSALDSNPTKDSPERPWEFVDAKTGKIIPAPIESFTESQESSNGLAQLF